MPHKSIRQNLHLKFLCIVFLYVLFSVLMTGKIVKESKNNSSKISVLQSARFREQKYDEAFLAEAGKLTASGRGTAAAKYLAKNQFGLAKYYQTACDSIWNDVQYFPVPESSKHSSYTISFADSWMQERTYGGKRGHEGTDLIAGKDTPGLYPVVSMTDGTVTKLGWLPKGGYRIGISAPGGAYFYYAHLDSYAGLSEKDNIKAGDILGFMGNSGYGPEGTKGMFATHLHVGIYLYPDGKEISVNPYWILKFLEEKKLSCSF